jgi:aquaporin Z
VKDHLPEYFAEFLGTAIMMIVGIGAVCVMFAADTPLRTWIPSDDLRRLLTGIIFAAGATAVVLSPLGQRSGGHLNPAVTLSFWWKGQVQTRDALAYCAAQIAGATLGVFVVAMIGGTYASSVQLGLTLPGDGYSAAVAFAAEIVITFLLVFLIVFCVNNQRFATKTPYLAGALVAFLVFVEAPISGTSLNPARSFAPSLLTSTFTDQWLYWLGPPIGALLAVIVFSRLVPGNDQGGCAKLFHTERYRCIFLDCAYRVVKAGTVVMREGETADTAYVVERGALEVRMRTEDRGDVVLGVLKPGDWFGEMALLLELPRSATVIAIRDSELRTVTQKNFAHVIAEHPEETRRLLKQLSERLHEANRRRPTS